MTRFGKVAICFNIITIQTHFSRLKSFSAKSSAQSMQPTRRLSNIKRVCIVGGGPAGVAAAK